MLQIRRMGPQIGVEITGIDVKTMDEATWKQIYQAWLDHNVMVVRDQELTIPDFIAYGERFGPVVDVDLHAHRERGVVDVAVVLRGFEVRERSCERP